MLPPASVPIRVLGALVGVCAQVDKRGFIASVIVGRGAIHSPQQTKNPRRDIAGLLLQAPALQLLT